jgi:hypothetical protein
VHDLGRRLADRHVLPLAAPSHQPCGDHHDHDAREHGRADVLTLASSLAAPGAVPFQVSFEPLSIVVR